MRRPGGGAEAAENGRGKQCCGDPRPGQRSLFHALDVHPDEVDARQTELGHHLVNRGEGDLNPWVRVLAPHEAIQFAMLSIFFIAVLIPGSFAPAGGRSDVTDLAAAGVSVKSAIPGKAGAIVLYFWLGGMLQLAVSFGMLNLLFGGAGMLLPSAAVLIDAALVTPAGGILMAAAGVLLTAESRSASDAKPATKSAFILLLLGVVDVYFVLPKAWKTQIAGPGSGCIAHRLRNSRDCFRFVGAADTAGRGRKTRSAALAQFVGQAAAVRPVYAEACRRTEEHLLTVMAQVPNMRAR